MNTPTRSRLAPWRPYAWWILPVAFLSFMLLTPEGRSEEKDTHRPDLSESGKAFYSSEGFSTYQNYCMLCHGQDGRGDGSAAKFLRDPPKDLTTISARRGGEFPFDEVYRIIDGREGAGHGGREMPIWGERLGEAVAPGVHPDEVARGRILTLIEHLKSIQRAD